MRKVYKLNACPGKNSSTNRSVGEYIEGEMCPSIRHRRAGPESNSEELDEVSPSLRLADVRAELKINHGYLDLANPLYGFDLHQ